MLSESSVFKNEWLFSVIEQLLNDLYHPKALTALLLSLMMISLQAKFVVFLDRGWGERSAKCWKTFGIKGEN